MKDFGCARKILSMRILYNEDYGYTFDQELGSVDMQREHCLEIAHGVRTPIDQYWNEWDGFKPDVYRLKEIKW